MDLRMSRKEEMRLLREEVMEDIVGVVGGGVGGEGEGRLDVTGC